MTFFFKSQIEIYWETKSSKIQWTWHLKFFWLICSIILSLCFKNICYVYNEKSSRWFVKLYLSGWPFYLKTTNLKSQTEKIVKNCQKYEDTKFSDLYIIFNNFLGSSHAVKLIEFFFWTSLWFKKTCNLKTILVSNNPRWIIETW